MRRAFPFIALVVLGLAIGALAGAALERWGASPRSVAVPAAAHDDLPDPDPTETGPSYEELRSEIDRLLADAETRAALVVPPPAAPAPVAPAPEPAWLRHAVPPPPVNGRAMVALIIDDAGVDQRRTRRVVALPGPLTIAFLPYARDLPQQTAEARARGHELLVHVPMEPQSADKDPGPDVLMTGLGEDEIRRRLAGGLDRFEGYVGINNHMGSKFTADRPGMAAVMRELKGRGLLFLDSLTTGRSVGLVEARRAGVPAVGRDIFLDNEDTVSAVAAQLAKVEAVARRRGVAVAIGHPRDATVKALAQWLPTLDNKGIVLVPLTALARPRPAAGSVPVGQ